MNEITANPANLASLWARLGGAMIDGVISAAIILPIMMTTDILPRPSTEQGMTMEVQATYFIFGMVVFLALNGYLLLKRGQTIGKVVVKTKIVDLDGNLPKFGKLILRRYLILGLVAQIPILGGIAGIVNALFIFGKERRCVHDHLAGTRVVEA